MDSKNIATHKIQTGYGRDFDEYLGDYIPDEARLEEFNQWLSKHDSDLRLEVAKTLYHELQNIPIRMNADMAMNTPSYRWGYIDGVYSARSWGANIVSRYDRGDY